MLVNPDYDGEPRDNGETEDEILPAAVGECIHRGEYLRTVTCTLCGWRGRKEALYACKLHGYATSRKYQAGKSPHKVCLTCNDYDEIGDETVETKDLKTFFDRVYVINLDRRPDRMESFTAGLPSDWPFKEPERVSAIDGKKVHPPGFWKPGGGAWGCYRTHIRLIEDMLNRGGGPILLLEDDAVFSEDFTAKVQEFIDHLPDSWDMLYLGGQHLRAKKGRPRRYNEYVYEPFNVNRTHAFAVAGGAFGRTLYKYLHRWDDWKPSHHIDHHLGRLHESRSHRVYCPKEWLVGQAEGKSNISGRTFGDDRYWPSAEKQAGGVPQVIEDPFYAILGLHSSGSSALAGVCYHLGVHLGNKLVGYYGKDPDRSCGFEAIGLAKICEQVAKLRDTTKRLGERRIEEKLRWFINQKKREARKKGTVAGGKYPQLCVCGDALRHVCGDRLRVIAADRPLEESVRSIQRRTNNFTDERLRAHQEWLWEEKERLVASLPERDVLRVEYSELLEDPVGTARKLAEFMELSVPETTIEKAAEYVDPDRRHIKSETAASSPS